MRNGLSVYCAVTAACIAACALAVAAETDSPPAALAAAAILDSQELDFGSRSIIYTRIEPPHLKVRESLAGGVANPAEIEISAPDTSPAMNLRAWRVQETLLLSCTVYDGALTEVGWTHGGREIVFWSSIDFRDLAPLASFESGGVDYRVFMGLGVATRTDYETRQTARADSGAATLPDWPSSLSARVASLEATRWRVVTGAPLDPLESRAIAALHDHYEANRAALASARAQREAEQAASEARLKARQPQSKDTRIQYFPIRSSYTSSPPPGGTR